MNVSPQEACYAFLGVMTDIKQALRDLAEQEGLTFQQASTVHVLYKEGGMVMGAVAEYMHCDASNVTGIIDRLVTLGYVLRRELPEDRRAKQLVLTDKGQVFAETVVREMPRRVGFSNLTADELAVLVGLLTKIKAV